MKKIITFILVGFSLIAKGQISDALLSDTIDLWIYPNMVKSITATQVNDLFQYLNLNKLHKDSAAALYGTVGDTSLWSLSGSNITHKNTGYVIIDSLLKIYPLPAQATKVGRIPVLQTSGLVEWASPLAVYISGLDSASKTPTPSPLLIWLKDTTTGYVRLADTTNRVGIGTATPTEALDVNGNIKVSDTIKFGDKPIRIITSDSDSNIYIGYNAGNGTAHVSSTFIGSQAGDGADNTSYASIFGDWAGVGITNVIESIILGYGAGYIADSLTNVIFTGIYAGNGANNVTASAMIGNSSGMHSDSINESTFVGLGSGYESFNVNQSNFFGESPGRFSERIYQGLFIGNAAGINAEDINNSLFIHNGAGDSSLYIDNSMFIGIVAGRTAQNISHSIFIGDSVGYGQSNISNQLWIDNSPTTAPLIWGDFANDTVRVNGYLDVTGGIAGNGYWSKTGNYVYQTTLTDSVGIGTASPTQALDVIGKIKASENFKFIDATTKGISIGTLSVNPLYHATSVGYGAMNSTTTLENTAVGYYALYNDTTTAGGRSSAFGTQAGYNQHGYQNDYFGYLSGLNAIGTKNASYGSGSGAGYTGNWSTLIGNAAGWSMKGNGYNTVIGTESCVGVIGDTNTVIGAIGTINDTGNFSNSIGIGFLSLGENYGNNVISIGHRVFENNSDSGVFIVKHALCNTTPLMQGDLYTNEMNFSGDVTVGGDLEVTGGITMGDPSDWMDAFRQRPFYMTDFLIHYAGYSSYPWYPAVVGNGNIADVSAIAAHPGLVQLYSGTTTNSGYIYRFSIQAVIGFRGNEVTNAIYKPMVLDSVTTRFGFQDATSVTAPVDGAYFEIGPDSVLWGKTMAASSGSTTATSYTLAVNTWYRMKIVVNSNATRIDYYLYNDAGTVLWTDNLTTNIPTSYFGHGFITTKEHTGTGAGIPITQLDYMDVYLGNLTR